MLNITVIRKWNSESVRQACIKNDFYTCGDNRAYMKMLNMVDNTEPTTENIYKIAKDILNHSRENTIENIMFCIDKDAINTFYEVEE